MKDTAAKTGSPYRSPDDLGIDGHVDPIDSCGLFFATPAIIGNLAIAAYWFLTRPPSLAPAVAAGWICLVACYPACLSLTAWLLFQRRLRQDLPEEPEERPTRLTLAAAGLICAVPGLLAWPLTAIQQVPLTHVGVVALALAAPALMAARAQGRRS